MYSSIVTCASQSAALVVVGHAASAVAAHVPGISMPSRQQRAPYRIIITAEVGPPIFVAALVIAGKFNAACL
jgi:hypothetical protein